MKWFKRTKAPPPQEPDALSEAMAHNDEARAANDKARAALERAIIERRQEMFRNLAHRGHGN